MKLLLTLLTACDNGEKSEPPRCQEVNKGKDKFIMCEADGTFKKPQILPTPVPIPEPNPPADCFRLLENGECSETVPRDRDGETLPHYKGNPGELL